MLYQKEQLCFTEMVQMLLFLGVSVAACTKGTESEGLPTNLGKGQACQASFAQYSCRGSDCSGFCSQCLYILKLCLTEKEGNWMKISRREQFPFPLSFSRPALTKQRCCREGPGPALLYSCLLVLLVTLGVNCLAKSSPRFLKFL